VRNEEVFQRRQQKLDGLEARLAARLRQQGVPLPGVTSGEQPGQTPVQDAADAPDSLSPSPTAQAEPATSADNNIDRIGGKGNISNQASTIHNHISYYFVEGKFEESYREGESVGAPNEENESRPDGTADSLSNVSSSLGEKITEGIQSGSTGAAFVNESGAKATAGAKALPKSDREIEHWYYRELSVKDRCFVEAAAVLHGAPLRAIAEATKELYAPLKEKDEERRAQIQTQPIPQPKEEVPLLPASPPSSVPEFLMRVYSLIQQEERTRAAQAQTSTTEAVPAPPSPSDPTLDSIDGLLERTHTYTLRVNGATRLLWQDADSSGLSRFSVDLLRFLARESAMEDMFGFGSQLEQRFLDVIEQWPTKYRGERSWRSASALGVIWWYQDARNLLWRQANKWAKSERGENWEHAAALLDGAYQVERGTMKAGIVDTANSSILQLLDQWTSIVHQAGTERSEGYAAARAYALIGRKSPEVALKGLENLLRFPQPQALNEGPNYPPEDLFAFSVLKYVDIVRSGHIRQVLNHLADEAEHYSHWRGTRQTRGERRENPHQRTVALDVIFTAFFLVASCSLSAVDENVPATYTTTGRLSDHPSCPDKKGRDILLAGLLTTTEQPLWQDQLAALLCAIIAEKNYQPALYLMRRWGEIVLKDQSMDADVLEEAYAKFLVKVGNLILSWSADRGPTRLFPIGAYKRGLTLWQTDRRLPQPGFEKLATKVLSQLPEPG
jgi:hypothetical protein